MSTIKPRFALRSGEPCDPTQVNATVLPIAQELSGRLIDHNIAAGTFPQSRVNPGAYYEVSSGGTPYYLSVSADMQIPNTTEAIPRTVDPNAWRVPDSAEWTTVGAGPSAPANTAMTITATTGESVLWVIAQIQYGLAAKPYTIYPTGFLAPTPAGTPYPWKIEGTSFISAHPSLQFAIRVDGIIDESSITGMEDTCYPAPIGYLPPEPSRKDGLEARPYSIHTFSTPDTESLQVPVYPVRMQSHVPVDEGTHTIEVVVRRLPHVGGRDETFYNTPASDVQAKVAAGKVFLPAPVYVFNRKVLVVDLHVQAPATGSAFDVSTAAVEEGDLVSAATMGTPLSALATSMNDLGDGAIARNGLRNQHLPSRILYPGQVGRTAGNSTQAAKPGFGALGGTWNRVDDGAGGYAQLTGPFDFAANPGFVILLGNVALSSIRIFHAAAPPPAWQIDRRLYAWFTIQGVYQTGAVAFGTASAEMAISNPNVIYSSDSAGIDATDPLEMDVPLFEFFDYRNAPPAGGVIDNFRVLGGNAYRYNDGVDTGIAESMWRKSSLTMIAFRQ